MSFLSHYILVGQTPVEVELMEWAVWFGDGDNRRVALWTFGPLRVSTVFLGLDHRFSGAGPPIVFETMIFLWSAIWQRRCATWLEAEALHQEGIAYARSIWKRPAVVVAAAVESVRMWMWDWDSRFAGRYGKRFELQEVW